MGEPDPVRVVVDLPLSEQEQISELSKQIETAAQFEAILAECHPDLRTSVRDMLEPLLTFDPATGTPRIHE